MFNASCEINYGGGAYFFLLLFLLLLFLLLLLLFLPSQGGIRGRGREKLDEEDAAEFIVHVVSCKSMECDVRCIMPVVKINWEGGGRNYCGSHGCTPLVVVGGTP